MLILYGIFVDFNIAGPFLLQNVFHLSAIAYGWWLVFVASGYMIGSYCSSRLVDHFTRHQLIMAGIVGLIISSLMMATFAWLGISNTYVVTIPMFTILFFIGIFYPQCIVGSLLPFPHIAGSAGALFGFMVFLGGTVASVIISHLPEFNAIPLSTMILVQALLVLAIYQLLKQKEMNQS